MHAASRLSFLCLVLCWACAGITLTLHAAHPGARGQTLPQLKDITPADATQFLNRVRSYQLPPGIHLNMQLKQLPRRGPSKTATGTFSTLPWEAGAPVYALHIGKGTWHVRGGTTPAAWAVSANVRTPLTNAALQAPILRGINLSLHVLTLPFLYEAGTAYTGTQRISGQATHTYKTPTGTSFALHAGTGALVQATSPTLHLRVLSFKQTPKGLWHPARLEWMHPTTRDRLQLNLSAP